VSVEGGELGSKFSDLFDKATNENGSCMLELFTEQSRHRR
jgi:hypothetical protein